MEQNLHSFVLALRSRCHWVGLYWIGDCHWNWIGIGDRLSLYFIASSILFLFCCITLLPVFYLSDTIILQLKSQLLNRCLLSVFIYFNLTIFLLETIFTNQITFLNTSQPCQCVRQLSMIWKLRITNHNTTTVNRNHSLFCCSSAATISGTSTNCDNRRNSTRHRCAYVFELRNRVENANGLLLLVA